MKEKLLLLTVALMTASPLFFSCSVDDMPVALDEFYVEPESNYLPNEATSLKTFTAVLRAKDSVRLDTLDSNIKTAWQVGEKIAICYQKKSGLTDTAIAVVDSLSNGDACISAILDDADNKKELTFVYPASIANDKGGIDTKKLLTQHGTLADIIENYDAATGSGKLEFLKGDSTCIVKNPVKMKSCIAIGKITPKKDGKAMSGIKELVADDGTNTYHIKPEQESFDTTGIYVALLPISNKAVTYSVTAAKSYFCTTKGTTIYEGQVNTTITPSLVQGVCLNLLSAHYTAVDGDILTGTLTGKYKICIADGANVTLNSINIKGDENDKDSCEWAGITCLGKATLYFTGTNSVKGFHSRYPGIQAGPEGTMLTLDGSGSLAAYGGASGGAGIGSGEDLICGNITINGGSIDAHGGFHGAGIGSGQGYNGTSVCGNITINGGMIQASGGSDAAGIGCGYCNSTCGTITIGSEVKNLKAVKGGDEDSGCQCIGIGDSTSTCTCGTITIKGEQYPGGVDPNSGDDTFILL